MNTTTSPAGVLTTFGSVPSFAVGYVRDLRIRWALEEMGRSYEMRLIDGADQRSASYRREQPFGQVPCWRDDQVELFESGAILLHLAQQSTALMPADEAARARTVTWMFAAVNSVEPQIAAFAEVRFFHANEPWAPLRLPQLEQAARKRLADLDVWLTGREYLEGPFSVADILMASVLRLLDASELLADYPATDAYLARCLARPAYRRAMRAHLDLVAPGTPLN